MTFRDGVSVRGLNTAATLRCSAVAVVNLLLRPLVRRLAPRQAGVAAGTPPVAAKLPVHHVVTVTCRGTAARAAEVRAGFTGN